jgi:hypothetical protein
MIDTIEREVRRFQVSNDAGFTAVMHEHQQFHTYTAVGQGAVTRKGATRYALTDGSPVNRLNDGRFEIVATGEVV